MKKQYKLFIILFSVFAVLRITVLCIDFAVDYFYFDKNLIKELEECDFNLNESYLMENGYKKGEYSDADYDMLTSAFETSIIQNIRMNVILFDGICNLCNGAVTFVVKRDRKGLFRFVSLQSETGKSLLKRYAVESTNKTLYYFRNNRCYSKSTAILYILKDLGGFWQCLYPLILIPAKLRDAIYLLVSKYRYRIFGKADSCIKPFGFSSEESKRSD